MDTEYTQGICEDGAAILKNGEQLTIEEIINELRKGNDAVCKIRNSTVIPRFYGMICKKCGKPFLIWKTEFEGIQGQDPDIGMYKSEGHTSEPIDNNLVGDIKNWCGCSI